MNKILNSTGLYAGISMALFMAVLSITGDNGIGFIKYLKYIILIAFFIRADLLIKNLVPTNRFFQKAMIGGLRIAVIAGITVAVTTLILYAINPSFAPMKFNLIPQTGLQAITIAVMLFIETIALGFIFNFAIIQGLKPGAETINQ